MVAPSLVPAAASAAFLMVLPAVPSSVSTAMFNPQSFPPHQALGRSIASSVAPACTLPSVPHWPPFAQALVPQLATVPAGQGTKMFPGTPSLCLASTRSPVPGYLFRGCVSPVLVSWPLVLPRISLQPFPRLLWGSVSLPSFRN